MGGDGGGQTDEAKRGARDAGDVVDAVIIGGGPAGLSAALTLGRGMKSARVLDAGPPRNARATGVNNFVTRDGVAPSELRRIARDELGRYGIGVETRRVVGVSGEAGRFEVRCEGRDGGVDIIMGRRIILSVGMVDGPVTISGAELFWGHHIFQCPFCHGWEHRGRPWGVLASSIEMLQHALLFLNWTDRLTVFIGDLEVPDSVAESLTRKGIRLERRAVQRAVGKGERLVGLEVKGELIACEALIARPPQSQTALVTALGLALDDAGFVKVDGRRQTSRPGVFAAGDLCTPMQSAIGAAAAGQFAGASVCMDLMA